METKSRESTFPLVKDNLIKGMINACRLRSESDAKTEAPIYERNPYTDVDRLVGRLIGKYTVPFGTKQRICESGTDWTIELSSQGVEIDNHSDRAILLSRGQFTVYDWEKRDVRILNETPILIQPHDKCVLDCHLDKTEVVSIKLSAEKEILLLPKYEN